MKKVFKIFLLCLLTINLYANIEKHFKKAKGKSTYHNMKNIDFIYVINLDPRPEKFQICEDQLREYNIYPYRFSAVNGWELSFETLNDLGVKFQKWMNKSKHMATCYLPEYGEGPHHEVMSVVGRVYFCHCLSKGAIGCSLSHLSVLQDAFDSGYNRIWVMEDDIEILQNPHMVSDLIEKLDKLVGKNGWDVLFTDRDTKNREGEYVPCSGFGWRPNFHPYDEDTFKRQKNISNDFRKIGARFGTYSMIINRCGMEKILKFFEKYKFFLPYDMELILPPKINLYTVRRDVVSTIPKAISDNGVPRYLEKEK